MKNPILIVTIFVLTALFTSCNENDFENKNQLTSEFAKESAWQTILNLNKQWAFEENLDSIATFIHENMVIFTPGQKDRFLGKKAVLESYTNYMAYAETISLNEKNELVQLYNDNKTAIISYYAELIYKNPQGDTIHFSGREIYTLIWENNKWLAVAQKYSTNPK